jgi:hypothetical protein
VVIDSLEGRLPANASASAAIGVKHRAVATHILSALGLPIGPAAAASIHQVSRAWQPFLAPAARGIAFRASRLQPGLA